MKRSIVTGIVLMVVALAMLTTSLRHSEPAESKPLGKISGIVTDSKTGEPLAGVAILVVGTTSGAITDSIGRYVISGLAPGNYVLRASTVGYASQEISALTVTAGNTTQQDFQLAASSPACARLQIVDLQSLPPSDAGDDYLSINDPIGSPAGVREEKQSTTGALMLDHGSLRGHQADANARPAREISIKLYRRREPNLRRIVLGESGITPPVLLPHGIPDHRRPVAVFPPTDSSMMPCSSNILVSIPSSPPMTIISQPSPSTLIMPPIP